METAFAAVQSRVVAEKLVRGLENAILHQFIAGEVRHSAVG
jgi:hypothetical protein